VVGPDKTSFVCTYLNRFRFVVGRGLLHNAGMYADLTFSAGYTIYYYSCLVMATHNELIGS
jgi:hypothetical protein